MYFHGAADIHQHRHPWRAAARLGAVQGNQLAAAGQGRAHRAAQVHRAGVHIMRAPACQLGVHAPLERAHQGFKTVQVAGQPICKIAFIGRGCAARTGLGALAFAAGIAVAQRRIVGLAQATLLLARWRVACLLRHVLVHLLYQLL